MHTQNRKEWEGLVERLGAEVEPDGSGKDVAHIDGDEVGYWDPKYASVGIGVIHVKM